MIPRIDIQVLYAPFIIWRYTFPGTMTTDDQCRQNIPPLPLVVKVGGSLAPHIPEILSVLRASPRTLLIVPGGGQFADAIRHVAANDDASHWMAIAAMEQFGWMLASKGLPTMNRLAVPQITSVLLPYLVMREADPLPHSWNVTSDTIAAWVAKTLGIDLLILKSVSGIMVHNILKEYLTGPVESDSVDPCFVPFVIKNKIPTHVINGTHIHRIEQFLSGESVLGTRIGTTF
jgi:5-(aminomethyl)-3-furanmethanol phosphate kinase